MISRHYAAKPWTNHERRFAIERALKTRPDYILPIRLDDTELPGWPGSMAYLSSQRMALTEIINVTLAKLGRPEAARPNLVSPADRTAGEELLRACFRRALFTRMDSEINLGAMATSLGECIGQIQYLIPRFEAPELQNVGLQLLAVLDDIQRRCARSSDAGFSLQLPAQTRLAIDGLKLEAIQLLKRMRRRINASLQFPAALVTDHFYRADEGREPPRPTSSSFSPRDLTVQDHLTAIEKQMAREADDLKRQRRLSPTGVLSAASPLGNACILAYEVHLGRKRDVSGSQLEEVIMKCIRASKRPVGWVGEPGLVGGTEGRYGNEAVFHEVQEFPSGAMVGMVICRPGKGKEAYAIVFDEKFPEYFGILRREFRNTAEADIEVSELLKLSGRGEQLADSVRARGWTSLELS